MKNLIFLVTIFLILSGTIMAFLNIFNDFSFRRLCVAAAFWPFYILVILGVSFPPFFLKKISFQNLVDILICHNFQNFNYILLFLNNAFALLALFTLLFIGSSVRQMSGSMELWSFWLHVWPLYFFGTMFGIGCTFVLFILSVISRITKKTTGNYYAIYGLLSFIHLVLAFCLMSIAFPDA